MRRAERKEVTEMINDIAKACKETGIDFYVDDLAPKGFVGATSATLAVGNPDESDDYVEWANVDPLNFWFARLAEERLAAAGTEKPDLTPYVTEFTMPVSPSDVEDFVSDARLLLDGDGDPSTRFQDNDGEVPEWCEEDLSDVIDDIDEFLEQNPGETFTFESRHEEYDEDDFEDED